MLELLAQGRKKVVLTQPDYGYNFNSRKSTGKTAAVVASQTLNATYTPPAEYVAASGSNNSLYSPSTSGYSVTPRDMLAVGTGDFTFEILFWNHNSAVGYSPLWVLNNGNNVGLVLRFGDAGYGNRLQMSLSPSISSLVFSCPLTRTQLLDQWVHVAVVRESGMMRMYVNGVQQTLANGTNNNFTVKEFAETTSVPAGTSQVIIPANAVWCPEFAVYRGVKYAKNVDFTPSYPLAPVT